MSSISIWRGETLLARREAPGEAVLYYRGDYREGDRIDFTCDEPRALVQVDQAVQPARVYLPGGSFTFRPPLAGDGLAVYAPGAFRGEGHILAIRPDRANEYRNLAHNPADQRGDTAAFPHATATVETRNESVFAARNVLDGVHNADGHGEWPYGSWGIGARTDAEITLDFGREVDVDAMELYLRADFPHDAYWIQATVELSDGASLTFPLEGIDGPQRVPLGQHRVRWMKLTRLIKCDNPSAFPALRQWLVWGQDVN